MTVSYASKCMTAVAESPPSCRSVSSSVSSVPIPPIPPPTPSAAAAPASAYPSPAGSPRRMGASCGWRSRMKRGACSWRRCRRVRTRVEWSLLMFYRSRDGTTDTVSVLPGNGSVLCLFFRFLLPLGRFLRGVFLLHGDDLAVDGVDVHFRHATLRG